MASYARKCVEGIIHVVAERESRAIFEPLRE